MKRVSVLVIISYLFVTTGCATMFHGTSETISVRSEESDTRFLLNNNEIGKGTSAITNISKKDIKTATLTAEKKGCNSKSSPVLTEFDGVTLLGILLDLGIISILVIDWAATGATTKAKQKDYILTPECARS